MVRRLLERISAPVRGLHQAAYLLAVLTLASQALALLRDRTFAHTFGAGHILDLYYAAFRVPDLVFALVSSLVSAYVLIPRITGIPREEAGAFLSEAASFLLLGGGALCLLLALFMPALLSVLYPQFASQPYYGEFVLLARLLLVQPLLLGLSGVLGSVTQVERQFFLFALAPVIYNLGIIAGAVLLYPYWGLPGIGAGVVIGAVFYVMTNLPSLAYAGIRVRLVVPRLSTIRSVVRDSVPRSLALAMDSFTLLYLTTLAAGLGAGAVSVFTLAGNLENVPLSLIGGSYAVAAFPALSRHASDNRDAFTRVLSGSARHIILWSMVALALVVVLRAYIVRVVLGTGAFGWDATRLTAALLAIFVAGLVAQGLVLLFSRALYAVKQSWRPFFYQLGGALFASVTGLAFVMVGPHGSVAQWLTELLRVGGVPGGLVLALAFASTLGELFLAAASLAALSSAAPGLARALARPLFEGAIAAAAGGAAAYTLLAWLGSLEPLTKALVVFAHGTAAGIVGLVAAALVLLALGNREFADILASLSRLPPIRAALPRLLPPSGEEPTQP